MEGKIVGFDIDFAKAIADGWSVELVVEDMDFSAVLASVQQGMMDIRVAGINPTPEREKALDFQIFIFKSSYCVLTTADAVNHEFKTVEDLMEKLSGVQLGTVQQLVDENVDAEHVL